MATRDLQQNLQSSQAKLQRRLEQITSREFREAYQRQLDETVAVVTRLINIDPSELTQAQRAQLIRNTNILTELNRRVEIFAGQTRESVENIARAALDGSYASSGWAVNQYAGFQMVFGGVDDRTAAAAVGISGDVEALAGFMPRQEALRHKRILDRALDVNYPGDMRRRISRAVTDGIGRGEGIPKIRKRLQDALSISRRQAETIARTEGLRAMSLGSQIAYEESADQGVNIVEVWDATLDSRTRPDHVEMDGRRMDNETGMFSAPWGETPGPHRNGIAEQDINCRCTVTPEVEGFAPEQRRIRGQGLQPYQTAREWVQEQGLTVNDHGQRYNFL
jgi:SPP1 gp7 family putative phage head morphogenesis protein